MLGNLGSGEPDGNLEPGGTLGTTEVGEQRAKLGWRPFVVARDVGQLGDRMPGNFGGQEAVDDARAGAAPGQAGELKWSPASDQPESSSG